MTSHEPRRHRRLRTVAIVLGALVTLAYLGACAVAGHKLALDLLHADVAIHDGPAAPSRTHLPGVADPAPRPTAPPAVPATWSGTDEQAAADAAVYFFDLWSYTTATGDTARWRNLSDPACAYCASVATIVEQFYRNGGRAEGGAITVTSTSVSVTDGVYDVQLTYLHDTLIAQGPEGSAVAESGGGEAVLRVRPTWVRGESSWAIVDIGALDAAAPDPLSPDA